MSRIVYVNGRFQPYHRAQVHVEDRGFQFADGVYEVVEVLEGGLVDLDRHLDRLARSLAELAMDPPMARASLVHILRETVRRNRVLNGSLYLQVTRGAQPRDFLFPQPPKRPTMVCIARASARNLAETRASEGIAIKTLPDNRWARCDIKTVMLLPASLAKQAARAVGAGEAWFVDADGFVTEGASSNAWIVDAEGCLITRPVDQAILRGVTRTTLIDVVRADGYRLVERAFTVAEAVAAHEAFITSATNVVTPVVAIDGHPIGAGHPGPVARALRQRFYGIAACDRPPNSQRRPEAP